MKRERLVWFIAVAVLAAIILFMRQCDGNGGGGGNLPPGVVKSDTVKVVEVRVDTLFDTIWPEQIVQPLPTRPAPAPEPDVTDSTISIYADSTESEDVVLYYTARTRGTLLGIEHSYRLKVPREIRIVIDSTTTVTNTVTNTKIAHGLYFGGSLGYSPRLGKASLDVEADFVTRKGFAIGYGYDVLNDWHRVRYKVLLWPRKK